MDAAEALADLKQISTQVDRAVIVAADGQVEASSEGDAEAAARIARAGTGLYAAADRVRADLGRPRLTQLEVSTPDGSVFVVREGERTIVATTGVGPTVGLIFYDLKTCLRNVAEDEAEPLASPAAVTTPDLDASPPPGPTPTVEAEPPRAVTQASGAAAVPPLPSTGSGWVEVPADPRPGTRPAHGAPQWPPAAPREDL